MKGQPVRDNFRHVLRDLGTDNPSPLGVVPRPCPLSEVVSNQDKTADENRCMSEFARIRISRATEAGYQRALRKQRKSKGRG